MPDVAIHIGGREFLVSCQPGEEQFLQSAARMLDTEATTLIGQIGRMPEVKMLLMAGLMLADKTAALEDQVRAADERTAAAERAIERARATSVRAEMALSDAVAERFAELAAQAEAIADAVEAAA